MENLSIQNQKYISNYQLSNINNSILNNYCGNNQQCDIMNDDINQVSIEQFPISNSLISLNENCDSMHSLNSNTIINNSNPNCNSGTIPFKQTKMLNKKIVYAQMDTQETDHMCDWFMKYKLEQKDSEMTKRMIKQKDEELEKNNQLMNQFINSLQEYKIIYSQAETQRRLQMEQHKKTLTLLEEKIRKEKRIWLSEQSIRLGRPTTQRQSTKYVEIWEEGEVFKKIHQKLKDIQREKEQIERLKKSSNKSKSISKKIGKELPQVPQDGFSNGSQRQNCGMIGYTENSEYDLEQSEFNNIDKNEQKEIYQFKMRMLENEEKRFLLGKGGYSEVYKAYDLEYCREVACKIHHFDDTWNENIKESYIKHALRENEIHKDLNNRRIVRQFDTVEIDHNSFCTILEICSGPDLYFYLKQQKQIPEKEAKLIISQILSGLKYLNDFKQKIIHYDLKPQNILFHNGEVKITDFGLCKAMDENSEKIELTSQGVGTYWYQAPECFLMTGQPVEIDSKVDVWSVGVIFFEILFGQKPFGHDKSQQAILSDQTILNAREVIFPQKPIISDGCKEFIRKCLAYNQKDRYDVYEAYYSPYLKGPNQNGTPNQISSLARNSNKS
ncbi:protein kinase domain containing protein [Stylonychia lemnae]|uniref:Protein kinase domain containing protein n=1 Tax=Stylonychia lemnae TaxID=5949 RepID=A0A078A4K9_STYLE|nr:protein kinase domain containing protein [Stylonychia lemnae]|eukprot:CDW76433.1 protein kinase domain containing protein [Stylonychia lemnae]